MTKAEITILTDVLEGVSDDEFNSDGDLFVLQNMTYRILRVQNPTANAPRQ